MSTEGKKTVSAFCDPARTDYNNGRNKCGQLCIHRGAGADEWEWIWFDSLAVGEVFVIDDPCGGKHGGEEFRVTQPLRACGLKCGKTVWCIEAESCETAPRQQSGEFKIRNADTGAEVVMSGGVPFSIALSPDAVPVDGVVVSDMEWCQIFGTLRTMIGSSLSIE